jgi:hypothetical protein
MKSFYELSEMINENTRNKEVETIHDLFNELDKMDEGLGKWLGGVADAGARGIGRVANAAASGLGQGVMQGVKRGFEVAKHGNAKNQIVAMRSKMEKAINSGDPKQFATVAKEIHAELKSMRQRFNFDDSGSLTGRKGKAGNYHQRKRMPGAPTDQQVMGSLGRMQQQARKPKNPSVAANITPKAA